jgi:acyl-CoA thioesterase-1
MHLLRVFLILLLAVTFVPQQLSANNTAELQLRLLVLGDSLTAGYGLAKGEAFPAQLEEALLHAGYRVKVINAGVSGDTTAGGLARLEWTLADNPHLVIVELGANDALRGLPAEEVFANLDAILTQLRDNGALVILTGMQAPRNLGEEYTTSFDQVYPLLATKHGVFFYPFFLEGVALDPALNQADGLHPNAAGVRRIVAGIQPLVTTTLKKIISSGGGG